MARGAITNLRQTTVYNAKNFVLIVFCLFVCSIDVHLFFFVQNSKYVHMSLLQLIIDYQFILYNLHIDLYS